MQSTATYQKALRAVGNLVEEPGTNPEYERAQLELLSDLFGVPVSQIRGDLKWPHEARRRGATTATYTVEPGATVNAGGAVAETWCLVRDGEQVGDSFDTREEAEAMRDALGG